MSPVWFSRRSIGLHATLTVVVPAFCWLGWWQLHRALGGNTLSWAYTVLWPLFVVYACYLWWNLVHEPTGEVAARRALPASEHEAAEEHLADTARAARLVGDDAADAELARYNAYLAALHAADEAERN